MEIVENNENRLFEELYKEKRDDYALFEDDEFGYYNLVDVIIKLIKRIKQKLSEKKG